jgi:hypothetical protein
MSTGTGYAGQRTKMVADRERKKKLMFFRNYKAFLVFSRQFLLFDGITSVVMVVLKEYRGLLLFSMEYQKWLLFC